MKKIRESKYAIKDEITTIDNDINVMNAKLVNMQKLYARLNRKFSEKLKVEEKNTDRLVKTYEKMKPSEVAPLILKHNMKVILKIVDKMKPAIASKIMTEMLKVDKKRVVLVSEKYTGFDTDYTRELMKKEINEKDLGEGEKSDEGDSLSNE